MRLFEGLAVLTFGASLAAAAPSHPAAGVTRASLAGDWETVIASPRRPWVFVVHLEPARGGWTGSLSAGGLPTLPLHDIRIDSARVRFRFPPELDSLPFDGTLHRDEIQGHVPESGQMTPTRLRRVLPLPAPANHLEAWRQDVDYAAARLPEYDRSFTPETRAALGRSLVQLRRDLPRLNDARILVALSRGVALAGNAHTWLRLDPTRYGSLTTELPIRIWWFSDGPYVIRAATRYRRALGCRVLAIDGHDLTGVRRQVAGLFAGNPSWTSYLAPLYLTSPDYLFGLGVIPDTSGATFTFRDARGARFDVRIDATRIHPDAKPSESWQEVSPLLSSGRPPWATALTPRRERLPLCLRHPERAYWFDFEPKSGLLYFQFNKSDNADQGPSFRRFADSLTAFIAGHPVRNVVVDLRFNSGGNLDVARSFFRALGNEPGINRRGHLFAIIGPCTFSAGLYHAAQLKQYTRATFVGEAVGDRLDYWAEGGELVLPNSRAAIWYSNGFHRYSRTDYPRHRPYYEELSIPGLAPDVSAPMTSRDYFSGRDPALETIEARVSR